MNVGLRPVVKRRQARRWPYLVALAASAAAFVASPALRSRVQSARTKVGARVFGG